VQRCAKALEDQQCGCATRREPRCQTSGLEECTALGAMHLTVAFATLKLARQRCIKLVVYTPGLDLVSDAITKLGFWEIVKPFPLAPQASAIGRRPFFLDLGGNIGYHSLLFAMYGYDVVTVEPMPANRRVLAASLCLHTHLTPRITVVPVALVSPRANASACVLVSRGANVGNGELRCGATLPIDCKSPTNRHRRFLGYHRAAERGGARGACEVVPTRSLDDVLAQLKAVPDVIDVVKIESATRLEPKTCCVAARLLRRQRRLTPPNPDPCATHSLEGSECNALDGGPSLFARFRPRLIDVETQMVKVRECVARLAAQHRYKLHRARGPNRNRFMTPL
jgi:FkbM family methyltransferase